jgi:hypothetical protein
MLQLDKVVLAVCVTSQHHKDVNVQLPGSHVLVVNEATQNNLDNLHEGVHLTAFQGHQRKAPLKREHVSKE